MPNPVHFPLWQHPIVDREGRAVLDFQETMNTLFRQPGQLEETAASTIATLREELERQQQELNAANDRADAAEDTAAELAQTVTDLRDDLTALQETVAGHHP